jgi:hypothetical protein
MTDQNNNPVFGNFKRRKNVLTGEKLVCDRFINHHTKAQRSLLPYPENPPIPRTELEITLSKFYV